MQKQLARTVFISIALLAPVVGITGCASTVDAGHKEAVNSANQRWYDLRSRLLVQTAQRQFDTGDLDQAEKTLLDALATDPKNPQVLLLSGRVMLERGQLEKAYRFLQSAIDSDDKLAEPHYYQGVVLQRWQQFDAALVAYERACNLQPDHAGFQLAKSEMLIQVGRADDALELLRSRLTYFDQNAAIRSAIAHIHLMRNEPTQAADFFRQALVIQPENVQLLENLALAEIAADQAEQGVKHLEQLLTRKDYAGRTDLQRLLARGYERLGRPAMAKSVYLKLAKDQPEEADHWLRLGEISWAMKDVKGAYFAAQRCLALSPRRYEAHLLSGLSAQALGKLEPAIKAFEQAAALAPKDARVLVLQGLALEQAGRSEEAAKAYQSALEREPEQENAQRLLSRLEAAKER